MKPTPNQIIRGIRDLLRQDVAPEIKSERAVRSLRRIMALLRDVDWNEAGFQLARENAVLESLGRELLDWIGETRQRESEFCEATQDLRNAIDGAEGEPSFAGVHARSLTIRAALASFIEAASRRHTSSAERDAAAEIRSRIAHLLAGLAV